MNIENIIIDNIKFKIVVSNDESNSNQQLFLFERFEIGIWDYHKNKYQFSRINDNEYEFDFNIFLEKIRTCQTIVFDIKNEKGFIKTNLKPENISSKSTIYSTSFGKLKCEFYKNGSSGISVKLRLSPTKFTLKFLEETKSNLIFHVSSSLIKYYLVRKNKSYENSFNKNIPLKVVDNKIKIDKKYFLNNSIDKEETWLIVSLDGERVCYANYIGSINYKTQIKHICISLISQKTDLFIKTTQNIDNSYKKIKICIIGSCFSRLAFRSEDCYNDYYKLIYETPLTFFHISLATMTSPSIPYKLENLVGTKQKELNIYGKDFFEKNIFTKIADYKPEYIIFDNYPNFADDLIETSSKEYINNNYFLRDTPAIKNLETKNIYKNTSDEYFNIFKHSVIKFKDEIQKIIPLENLILIRSEPSFKKMVNNVLIDWENSQIIKLRKYLFNKFDSYFISQMDNIKVIDMRDPVKYYSENIPYESFSSNHLNSVYYKDLLTKINQLILIDKIKNCS